MPPRRSRPRLRETRGELQRGDSETGVSHACQVTKLTSKLEKLWDRHKQTQEEVEDLQQEFQTQREDMLETIRELRKEVPGWEQKV